MVLPITFGRSCLSRTSEAARKLRREVVGSSQLGRCLTINQLKANYVRHRRVTATRLDPASPRACNRSFWCRAKNYAQSVSHMKRVQNIAAQSNIKHNISCFLQRFNCPSLVLLDRPVAMIYLLLSARLKWRTYVFMFLLIHYSPRPSQLRTIRSQTRTRNMDIVAYVFETTLAITAIW